MLYSIFTLQNNIRDKQNLNNHDNHKIQQWTQSFLHGKSPHYYGDKKTTRSKTTNQNPLYKIKLQKFTQSFYPKGLPSNTYNFIHVYDTKIFNCSTEYSLALLKGCKFSTLDQRMNPSNERLGIVWLIRLSFQETLSQQQ